MGSPGPVQVARRFFHISDGAWAFVAVSIPVIGSLATGMGTVDLAYHIRAGGEILAGSFARVDSYSFAGEALPWVNQQWGAQVLFALFFRVASWNGVALLRAALTGGTFGLLYLACRASGARRAWSAALLTIGGYLVASTSLAMRPQLVGVLLFSATLWISATRHQHPSRLWLVPALVAIWANVHGSFVLGPSILLLAWLEDRRSEPATSLLALKAAILALGASVLTPFGPGVWAYAVKIATDPTVTQVISEWQATSIRDAAGLGLFPSLAVIAWLLGRRGERTSVLILLQLGFFLTMALFAVRGVVWWGLVAPIVAAGLLRPAPPGEEPISRTGSGPLNFVVAGSLLVAVILVLPFWRGTDPETGAPRILWQAEQRLVDETAAVTDPGANVWVSQVWGSWFEFALPQDKVFVDSRIEIYPESVWNEYLNASNARPGWQAILNRYEVDAVVLSREQSGWLLSAIRVDPGWTKVYEGANGAVFIRA